jgi:hypothetical protein
MVSADIGGGGALLRSASAKEQLKQMTASEQGQRQSLAQSQQ